ncbi:AraC family transcriptional regulator [Paenibacillus azoreducens]|uniref:AraC family transcriptional regulator n=1 Tax=Paenibacillus azoreducens TaxID=116718 RepID=UPI0039F63CC5
MIHSSNHHTDFHVLTARLWNVEYFHEIGLRLEQQLAVQHALIILLKGEIDLELEDRVIRISEGGAQVCLRGRTFGIKGYGSEPVAAAVFYFSFYQADPSRKDMLFEMEDTGTWTLGESIGKGMPVEKLQIFCRKTYKHFHHGRVFSQWRAQLDFQELLFELMEEGGRALKYDRVQVLEHVKTYIDEHYNEELTIDQLAEVAEFSPGYFADLFKKTYGCSVMDYVTEVRMNKAKQMMLGSGALLKEVAHLIGYKDEFYFSRKFKQKFGLSPSAYVKERRNKLALYGATSLLGYLTPLQIIPYAAPLHPKWSAELYHALGPEIPVHLDAYRQNYYKEANLNKLEEAQPERIICTSELEVWEKKRLKQIAPLYELSLKTEDWRGELERLAEMLDRTAEAEQWLGCFERKMKRLHRLIAQHVNSPTLAVVRVFHNQLALHNGMAVQEVLYEILGCQMPALPEGEEESPLSVDRLKSLKTDHMLMLVRQDSETLAYWRKLSSSVEWLSLPAVKAGRVYQISSYPWREHSPAAMEQMAESAAALLTGKNPCEIRELSMADSLIPLYHQ